VRTGITYGKVFPELVSPFEEREAAVYCHYRPTEFAELPEDERAACIAQYRLHHLVEQHAEDAVGRAVELMRHREG
jgi:hypothetical protein